MSHQSCILALSAMILLSGCQFPAPGERAGSNDACFQEPCPTSCPEGETCSPNTPNGLFFSSDSLFGTLFGSPGPHPIAEGGTERIDVFVDSNGTVPFKQFDAEATTPLEIASIELPSVMVRGTAKGAGFLRIVDDKGALHDRISLEVLPIASTRMVDAAMALLDAEGAESLDLALFAGSSVNLGLMLFGEGPNGPTRLVDHGATLTIAGDATDDGDTSNWDQRFVTVGASGAVSVAVTAGAGESFDLTMPIVDKVDDIASLKSLFSSDLAQPLVVGSGLSVCFRGISGTRAVGGLAWAFSGEGMIEVKPLQDMCASIKALAAGNASIVVQAGGMTKKFPVTMKAAIKGEAPAEKASFPGEVSPGLTPGERAGR